MLTPEHPAGRPDGFDALLQFPADQAGLAAVAPDIAAARNEEVISASLEFVPDEDADFIRQLFLLNRFM